MPDLKLEDVTLHYEVDGSGPPLILLSGMLIDGSTWAPILPRLAERYTVVRPDNRSTGRTVPWDAPISVAHMARDALALMTHLGFDRFHAAGHSMGGLMALEMTALAPDRIATATVLASGRAHTPRTMAVFDALLATRQAEGGEETWLKAFYPWLYGQAFFATPEKAKEATAVALAYPYAQTADAMAHQMEALRTFKPVSKLAQTPCPVHVLYAEDDLLITPTAARKGFAKIPDLTEHTVADAGHSIIWDAPVEVGDHMRAYLDAHPID